MSGLQTEQALTVRPAGEPLAHTVSGLHEQEVHLRAENHPGVSAR